MLTTPRQRRALLNAFLQPTQTRLIPLTRVTTTPTIKTLQVHQLCPQPKARVRVGVGSRMSLRTEYPTCDRLGGCEYLFCVFADASESGNETDDLPSGVEAAQLIQDIEQDDQEDAEPPWTEPRLHSARWYALRKDQALFPGTILCCTLS